MSTKDFSKVQEQRIADYLNWRVVPGSGARDFNPGDIESDDWLGECKTHVNPTDTIVFYRKFWDKICQEAESKFKYPALFVDCGTQKVGDTWVLFDTGRVRPNNAEFISTSIVKCEVNIRFNIHEISRYYRSEVGNIVTDVFPVISVEFKGSTALGLLPLTAFVDMV